MKSEAVYQHTIPENWNFLVYCFKGAFEISQEDGDTKSIDSGTSAFMEVSGDEEVLEIKATEEGSRFMLIAGLPLKEPIASYGPFVMNTDDEISDTISDFNDSDNGFEGADTWQSEIKDMMDQ